MMAFRYIVEPISFFYFSSVLLHYPVLQQYVYKWYSAEYGLEFHVERQSSSCAYSGYNTTEKSLQKQVQKMSSSFFSLQSLCQSIPCVITLLLYGSLSDMIGRKPVMIFTTAMTSVSSAITVVIIKMNFDVKYIWFSAFLDGIGGSLPGMFIGMTAYIADIATKDGLTLRLAINESILLIALAGTYFYSGYLITSYSFFACQFLISSLSCVALLWTLLILKESLNVNKPGIKKERFHLKQVISVPNTLWSAFTKKHKKRWIIYLSMATMLIANSSSMSHLNILTLYFLSYPFCFTAISIGYYVSTLLLVAAVGMALGIKIGLKIFSGPALSLIAYFCNCSYFIFLALSEKQGKNFLYAGLAFKAFSMLYAPVFRSILSKATDESSQGSIFSILICLEQLCSLLMMIFYNYAYTRINIAGYAGYFFFIPPITLTIPTVLTIIYWVKTQNASEDTELKPLIKKMSNT